MANANSDSLRETGRFEIPTAPGAQTEKDERTPWYKLSLTKRIIYGVLSLILAMLLWGYVLMTRNPPRTKTFQNVSLSFESGTEADLILRKLMVYGKVADVLKPVSVTVSAPLTDISKIREKDITATVSLNDVPAAGTYSLEIKATSSIGTVVDITPSTVEIEVDDIVSRLVSISYDYVGELPEGYWHDTPVLSDVTATIEGARSNIERVDKAICYIDLNGLTESMNSLKLLTILDNEGNEMERSDFKSVIPSVSVQMAVFPHKHVTIGFDVADIDQLPDIFEVQSITLNYESLDIAAPADVLAQISEITSDPVYLSTVTQPESKTIPLTLHGIPDSSRVIGGDPNNVQLTVVIADKQISQLFSDVPIKFVGESSYYDYTYEFENVNVRLTGPARLIREMLSSDFLIAVNVEGRGVGDYDLLLESSIADTERFADIGIEILKSTVHVAVRSASGQQ